jgi:hypothetical protein
VGDPGRRYGGPVCECGEAAEACETAWGECLSLEFRDPEYGVVHHLTVASHMLQHPSRLSAAGWWAERRLLAEFLDDGKRPEEVRRRSVPTGRSLKRGEPQALEGMTWSRTVVHVGRGGAEAYRRDVRSWARAVLDDLAEGGPAEG